MKDKALNRKKDSFIVRTKTAPNLIAQNNNLCTVRNAPGPTKLIGQSTMDKIKVENWYLYHIIGIMSAYGLRISEVLNIHYTHILHDNKILIKGLKGSEDKIIYYPELEKLLIRCKTNLICPFEQFNRFYIYREFKKYGITYKSATSSKMSVTHAIRHKYVENLRVQQITEENIQHAIGHRNIKNTQNYGHKNKTSI